MSRYSLPPIVPPKYPHQDPVIWVARVGFWEFKFDSVLATAAECRRMACVLLQNADRVSAGDDPFGFAEAYRFDAEMCIRWAQLKDFAARDMHKYTRKDA
ncbi:hypothetical protein [Mycobacteroides abscessus]|uniref:hypothetical protein n=1 Tax=Mycobacteroides abscessus TaxID=36809 RepID=UPI00092B3F07|nr:hypothetical protein [Mycobacteroides abscessus]SHW13195.1 Uncharacterised protein [Mycobacteroides abscessus subsp. abscessus]SKR19306.1 Uncharacterised protein [Mycobacteroides abscessus subsp. abscessus]SKR64249.1 Uncharacterised protein [Mycobacteroides abscessus subsp. abscessus]SKT42356.1 Uncharacterised protein [Mycobacteroides abscessus subsp. abscessus]